MGAIHGKKAILFLSLATLCLSVIPLSLSAQITFEKTYGGSQLEWGHWVDQTSDGGYIVTGMTESFGAGMWDVYLVKTDSLGNTLWDTTYGGAEDDMGYCVQQTQDGGYIVAGETKSFGADQGDVFLIKTDTLGNVQWEATFGDTSELEYGSSVQQTSDGGYVVAGTSMGPAGTFAYLLKVDSSGNLVWTALYGDSLYQRGLSVQETKYGGYIVVGETYAFPNSDTCDVYLVRTDSLGTPAWERDIGGNLADGGHSVQLASDGGYIIAGYTESFGAGGSDVYLVKTDSLGSVEWEKAYGGTSEETGSSVDGTSDGGYVLTGLRGGWPFCDLYLIRTDSAGNLLWDRVHGGSNPDEGTCVQETKDGGYIVTGFTTSFGAGSYDIYLIKTDENGLTGIEEEREHLRVFRYELRQNHPNPFYHSTVISYSLPSVTNITLTVYDITGRLVETLVNEFQQPGIHQVRWDRKDNPSGVYFYRLRAGEFIETRKMVVVK